MGDLTDMFYANKENVEESGSCNFCNRGKHANGKYVFPYKNVYVIASSSSSIEFRLCALCFKELKLELKKVEIENEK